MEKENNKKPNEKQFNEIVNQPEKGPLSFLTGSITSFILFIAFYKVSIAISIYF